MSQLIHLVDNHLKNQMMHDLQYMGCDGCAKLLHESKRSQTKLFFLFFPASTLNVQFGRKFLLNNVLSAIVFNLVLVIH